LSSRAGRLQLDLNNPEFQRQLFELPKEAQRSVLAALGKLSRMTWEDVYRDAGLRWEAIVSRLGPQGGRLYSLRMGKGSRAVAYRQENWLRILTLHPDHDSAYEEG
jgi:hypothetical protein